MSKYQVYIVAEGVDKSMAVVIKRIRPIGTETWFSFPDDFQKILHHKSLLELPPVKAALNAIKSRGQFRTVNVTLTTEIEKLYVDEDKNFIFQDHLLQETRFIDKEIPNPEVSDLVSCISKAVSPRKESIKDILKHFLIEKFSPKNRNVIAWCDLFEKESNRFELKGQKQIEVFKSCLDEAMSDWFAVNQRKIGISAEWACWKADLISTFGDSSWKPIRYAFNFRYINGSYIEYVMKKEKMLLDLDRDLSDLVILDLIVVGLPSHVQNSLNRHSVKDIKILITKLKKFEAEDKSTDNVNKQKSRNFNSTFNVNASNANKNSDKGTNKGNVRPYVNNDEKKTFEAFVEKKPCPNCSNKGFPDRYHPESKCWFKNKEPSVPKFVNSLEVESPTSSDFSDGEVKN